MKSHAAGARSFRRLSTSSNPPGGFRLALNLRSMDLHLYPADNQINDLKLLQYFNYINFNGFYQFAMAICTICAPCS
jgi:hypothetical protein